MHTAIVIPRASWAIAAACLVLVVGTRSRAEQVTVTGEFSSFRPETGFIDSVLTAYDPAGPTTLSVASGQATALPSGTSKIDFLAFPSPFVLTNTFEFNPGDPVDVNRGDVFRLGSFTFTNGTWFDSIDLAFTLTTHSSNAALDNQVFAGTMVLVVNPNDQADPYISADYFYIAERPDLGSVRVFERAIQPSGDPGYTGTVDFYGRIGSLIPTGFAHPSPAAFLSHSITADPQFNPVPEPASLVSTTLGLAILAFAARARRLL